MNDEAARRRKLIEATIATLAEVGFPAASLSEIARRAQVSTGLFAHYFGDKDGLLEATLRFMAARLSGAVAARLRAAKTPRERLYALCEAALGDQEFDRPTGAVWLAFWSQVAHSPRYQRIQRLYERRLVSNLRHALRGLVAESGRGTVAALIGAAIDGLWLRASAGGPGEGAAARGLLRALVDGLLASPHFAPPPEAPRPPPRLRGEAPAAGERAARLRSAAGAIRAMAPALARQESADTGRPLAASLADAQDCARAFEAAAAIAEGLRRLRVEGDGGRVEETFAARGRAVELCAHWSAPLLGLGRAALAMARGDGVRLVADPHAAASVARALAAFEGALEVATRPFPLDPDARFGRAGRKSALVVLPGADLGRAARAARSGGRAWSRSSFASQSVVFAQEATLAAFLAECGRMTAPEGAALSPAHADWIAQMAHGRQGWALPEAGPEAPLARAHLFGPLVAVIGFAREEELAEMTKGVVALGMFAADEGSTRRWLGALDAPLAYVNDDGRGPLAWPEPQEGPTRRIVWGV